MATSAASLASLRDRVILDLCAGSGEWSAPYVAAGYRVLRYDFPWDIRLMEKLSDSIHGIVAAPPCTMFANSGARWERLISETQEALSLVDACLRAVVIYSPAWWALENPAGTLSRWLGEPTLRFDPCDYGDPWTKRTSLWGRFALPKLSPVEPTEGSKIHRLPPSVNRAARRAQTPPGFARAFFTANP